MPIIKRRFYISCRGDDCLKLAEVIRENITITEAEIMVRDYGLIIELYGYKTDVKNAWNKIRKLIVMYKSMSTRLRTGEITYPVDYLVSIVRRTFPPLVLVEILKRRGYSARYEEGKIITNASLDDIKPIIERIAEIFDKIRYDVRGTTSKYFVIAASIILDMEPDEVIERALKAELMYKDEDDKARIRYEWRQALDRFIKIFSGGGEEA